MLNTCTCHVFFFFYHLICYWYCFGHSDEMYGFQQDSLEQWFSTFFFFFLLVNPRHKAAPTCDPRVHASEIDFCFTLFHWNNFQP